MQSLLKRKADPCNAASGKSEVQPEDVVDPGEFADGGWKLVSPDTVVRGTIVTKNVTPVSTQKWEGELFKAVVRGTSSKTALLKSFRGAQHLSSSATIGKSYDIAHTTLREKARRFRHDDANRYRSTDEDEDQEFEWIASERTTFTLIPTLASQYVHTPLDVAASLSSGHRIDITVHVNRLGACASADSRYAQVSDRTGRALVNFRGRFAVIVDRHLLGKIIVARRALLGVKSGAGTHLEIIFDNESELEVEPSADVIEAHLLQLALRPDVPLPPPIQPAAHRPNPTLQAPIPKLPEKRIDKACDDAAVRCAVAQRAAEIGKQQATCQHYLSQLQDRPSSVDPLAPAVADTNAQLLQELEQLGFAPNPDDGLGGTATVETAAADSADEDEETGEIDDAQQQSDDEAADAQLTRGKSKRVVDDSDDELASRLEERSGA